MSAAASPRARPSRPTPTRPDRRQLAGSAGGLVIGAAVLFGLMVGIGELLTRVLKHDWPVNAEDGIDRSLAAHRTGAGDSITFGLSELGNTFTIIGLMVVVALALRLVLHRWLESVFVVVAVSTQALVFFCTQLLVKRARPGVHRLDSSPPTSSYPSGHTGAAVALYGALALVAAWTLRHSLLRLTIVLVLLAIPLLVAYSRLYRGMHHPTDVVSAALNGGASIWISARATLRRSVERVAP